jgi:uncharacterized protein (DUF1499 family)
MHVMRSTFLITFLCVNFCVTVAFNINRRMPLERSCLGHLQSTSFDNLLPRLPTHSVKNDILQSLVGVAALVVATKSVQALESSPQLGIDESGLFQLCPDKNFLPSCTSSQDDRPKYFIAPWSYDGSYENIKRRIVDYIGRVFPKGSIVSNSDRYLRYEFRDSQSNTIDDTEFYFTPDDNTVQYRSCRRGDNIISDFGANGNRIEKIRIGLGLESVPILRNRRRKFIFGESPFDEFGPSTIQFEESNGVFGDADPKAPVFETPSPQLYNSMRRK